MDVLFFWPISWPIKCTISFRAKRKRGKYRFYFGWVEILYYPVLASECGPLQILRSPIGVPAVALYLLSSACQILSISEKHEVGRTTRTKPFAESQPDPLPCESPGISDWQIKDFMAPTAILNSSVMKARRSITHLFVFLLLWITVSIADSSLEWNENKTIIHRVKPCRKGEKAMISFRSSALSPWWVICTPGKWRKAATWGESGWVLAPPSG